MRGPMRSAHWRRGGVGLVAAALTLLAGCTNGTLPTPRPSDNPERAATELAAGLARKDLSAVEFAGSTASAVNTQFAPLVKGMGPVRPSVRVTGVDRSGDSATATLQYTWAFPGVPQPYTYSTAAPLRLDAGRWKTNWQAAIVHSQLDGTNRLSQRRVAAERGDLLGADGERIMVRRPVVRIGLDKSEVSGAETARSATRLARLVGIDVQRYRAKVGAAGSKAFVEAITFRAQDPDRPRNADVFAITGALPIQDEQVLAPTRDFARPIVGTVGEASKEIVDASGGAVVAGDQVGLSGLQRRYDSRLRGTPGVEVRLLADSSRSSGAGSSPGVSTSGSGSPSSSAPGASASPRPPVTLFQVKPVAGEDLTTTLNVYLQKLAERVLARSKPASALVAIQPSTGGIVAAGNNAATRDQSLATVGQAAPGSTFKVISSLALLRAGLKPTSPMTCPRTVKVAGRIFTNYSDYPSSALGTIDLQTALAQSCNTAFIGQRGKLGKGDLAAAAGSLGLGIDYDTGFPSYFGAVSDATSGTGRAAAMIGQGTDLASPMVLAAVVASVQAGHTVIPQLVTSVRATSKAKPVTSAEAAALRSMMRAVVIEGSGRRLADVPGPAVIAKTGTAEYGTGAKLKTHAWMIAAQGDLAVAVFVNDGQSGSRSAGPLLERFLRGAR